MKNFGAKWLALALAVGAAASLSLNGCGDGGGGGTAGTTGGAGRGGTTGQAGRGGTGGSTAGTGGGVAGRGGTGGGTAGTGGGTAGSTAGSGGGTAGSGGGVACPGNATFNTATESFALNTFAQAGNLAILEGGTPATLAHNTTEGDPTAGSLKVDAPFSDYNQYVDIQRNLGPTMLRNWTGAKLHVRVKVASGGNPSAMNPMGIQPYVNTGASYNGYCSKYTNLVAGNGWNDYVLDLSTCAAASSDPSMVVAFGVSIQAGNGMDGDGGVNSMKPTAAVIYIDTFMLEGNCGGGTGGTGGGAGGTAGGAGGSGGRGGSGGTAGAGGATAGAGGGTAGAGGATAGAGGGTAGATAGAGGGTAGAGGGTAGAAGGAGGAGGSNLPACTSTTATSPAMSAADYCTLLFSGCTGTAGFTNIYADMAACTAGYPGLSETLRMCRSYHLCNALGAGPKATHCPHAVGMNGQCGS
jgi:hypothetical protein